MWFRPARRRQHACPQFCSATHHFTTSAGPAHIPLGVVWLWLRRCRPGSYCCGYCVSRQAVEETRGFEKGALVCSPGWAKHQVLGSRLCPGSSVWLWLLNASSVFRSIICLFMAHCRPGACGQVHCRAYLCSAGNLMMSADSCQAIQEALSQHVMTEHKCFMRRRWGIDGVTRGLLGGRTQERPLGGHIAG